jgi:DNA-binding PadR family transcriptional regulator
MSRRPDLTTTSYGILGLLAIRPWTTYELAQQMERSLARMWPRARSKIYEEPKKLVARGLAVAVEGKVGRRRRTVYSITPKGRRTLAEWLSRPGSGPALEYEQLLKVFFAEHGTKEDVISTISDMQRWARESIEEHVAVARSYLSKEGPFQERAAYNMLTGGFLFNFAEMVGRWSEWALKIVEEWPEDVRAAKPKWAEFEEFIRRGSKASKAGEE